MDNNQNSPNEDLSRQLELLKEQVKALRDDKQASFFSRYLKPLSFFQGMVVAILICSASVVAVGTFSVPHVFTSNTLISAQQMNENFQAIADEINNLAGGSSGSSDITVQIVTSSDSIITITASDNNKFYIVDGVASFMDLPDAATAGGGFILRMKQVNGGLLKIRRSDTSDQIDGVQKDFYMSDDSTAKSAVVTLISDGNEWSTLFTNGYINNFDFSSVTQSCNGEGTGTGSCYYNSTAQSEGYAYVNGFIVQFYSGSPDYWNTVHRSLYLLKDDYSDYTTDFVGSYNLAMYINNGNTISQATNGLYYYYDSYDLSKDDVWNYNTPAITHNGSTDPNYGNTTGKSKCDNLGSGWRLPLIFETMAYDSNGIPGNGTSWVYSAEPKSSTTNHYLIWKHDGSTGTIGDTEFDSSYHKMVCVRSTPL